MNSEHVYLLDSHLDVKEKGNKYMVLNPHNVEVFLCKLWRSNGFQIIISINVLVSSFRFI